MAKYTLDEYRAKLERVAEKHPEYVAEALRKSAVKVKDRWAELWSGPILKQRTGQLVGSLTIESSARPLKARVFVGNYAGHSQKYKAIAAENGTARNHPGGTPYLIQNGKLQFIKASSARAAGLPRTKPHTIPSPRREAISLAWRQSVEYVRGEFEKTVGEAFKNG